MAPIWHLRVFRVWLILYVPVALFFGYHVLTSAIEISNGRQAIAKWIEIEQQKVDQGKRKPITPVDVQFEALSTDFERFYEIRNISLVSLIAGLSIPGIAILIGKILGWIWASNFSSVSVGYTIESAAKSTINTYLRWYKWACAAGALFAVGLLIAPESMARATVSALVQAIGILVVAWIFIRVKEWWSWRTQK